MEFSTYIDLDSAALCAEGGGSRIYLHPDFENVLLKVPKRKPRTKISKKLSALFRHSKRRFGMFREWHTEYEEYIATLKKIGHCPDVLPKYLGFIDTTLGIASVVEKVHDEGSDEIADTLSVFIEKGDGAEVIDVLEDFFVKIDRHQIIFRDLHPGNLCVIRNAEGKPDHIICVDGLGDFTLMRVRTWSKTAYRIWHKKEKERLLELSSPS